MDVRCERCGSQYELDEDRVTEAGVAVRCTHCDHVFMVKKQAVAVTSSISQLNGPPAPKAGPSKLPPSSRPTTPFGASLEEFSASSRPPPQPGPSAAPRDPNAAASFENFFRPQLNEPAFTRSGS